MGNNVSNRVLGVSGSMAQSSRSSLALRAALDGAGRQGAQTRLIELCALDLPMYRPGPKPEHAGVGAAAEAALWADAFILASPDYHGAMSGALKNFLDYHWREFAGKLFGYICTSNEKGLTVMEQMRTAIRQCYGWSLPYGVSVHPDDDFAPDGTLREAPQAQRLAMMGRDVAVYGSLLRAQFEADRRESAVDSFAARYR